jgi:hypothetical protein
MPDVERFLCIVGRLMGIAVLIPRVLQDVVAIAQQLRVHPDPKVQELGLALHNPERLKTCQTHL